MGKITDSIISNIVRNTGVSGITEKQSESVKSILTDKEYSIDDKIDLIMQELNLIGSIYRTEIYDAIEFYLEFIT